MALFVACKTDGVVDDDSTGKSDVVSSRLSFPEIHKNKPMISCFHALFFSFSELTLQWLLKNFTTV